MEIHNWFDLIIFTLFTLAVILIGIPMSIYLMKKGIEGFFKFGFDKFPKAFMDVDLGSSFLEVLSIGLFIGGFSIWYLFIDKDGQLFNWLNEIKRFFH